MNQNLMTPCNQIVYFMKIWGITQVSNEYLHSYVHSFKKIVVLVLFKNTT